MKKAIAGLLIVIVLLGGAWAGSVFYVSRQIELSLADFESQLVDSGELAIHRLEYEAGFLSGQLHYDLEWQPDATSEFGMVFSTMREQAGYEFRMSGTADVRHGPYVSGPTPLALARMDREYHLPPEARNSMPQYPGDIPFVHITGVLGFDGSLQAELKVIDYSGTVIENGERIDLSLSGINGSFTLEDESAHIVFATDLAKIGPDVVEVSLENFKLDLLMEGSAPELTLDLEVGRLGAGMEQPSFSFNMEQIKAQTNSSRVQPAVWVGQSSGSMGAFEIGAAGYTFAFRDTTGSSRTALDNAGRLEAVHESLTGSLEVGEHSISDIYLDISFRNINVDAYSRFSRLGSNFEAAMGDPTSFMLDLLDAINGLLADQPVLSLDRLAFSVLGAEDISLSYSISYTGDGQLESPEQAAELVNGIESEANATLSIAAVRELMSMFLSSADPSLSGANLDQAVESTFQEFLLNLENSGLATISNDTIRTSMRLSDGNYTVNGTVVSTTDDLVASLLAPDSPAPASSSTAAGGSPVEMQPEFFLDPRFERANLASGFAPDPYTVKMVATGQRPVYEVLGADCAGNVNSPLPDVTLSYLAGTDFDLYVYAESDADTALIVLTPDGWFCDDDSHGNLDPGVHIDLPETGDYMIWVGTYDTGSAKAVLGISER